MKLHKLSSIILVRKCFAMRYRKGGKIMLKRLLGRMQRPAVSYLAWCAVFALVGMVLAAPSFASELITNGGFETGTFAGWTVVNQTGGNGNMYISSPGSNTPNGFSSAGNPSGGSFYAVSDQTGPGTHALLQTFTVPSSVTHATLSFQMFVNDWDGGPTINPAGLDYTASPNEHARVDILSAGASPLDTGAGVLQNLYLGADLPVEVVHPYTNYSFDITPLVSGGGTFQLRFAEVDNQSNFNLGVDNVSIQDTVPEPSTFALLGIGAVSLLAYAWRRRRSAGRGGVRPAQGCVVAAILLCASVGRAEIIWDPSKPVPVSMADVDAAGGLLVGDKLFTSFSAVSSGTAAVLPNPTTIMLSGFQSAAGDDGVQFDGGWMALSGQTVNSTIAYEIRSRRPADR